MVHESLLTATSYASGSHPRRVFSLRYPLTGFFHCSGLGDIGKVVYANKSNKSGGRLSLRRNHGFVGLRKELCAGRAPRYHTGNGLMRCEPCEPMIRCWAGTTISSVAPDVSHARSVTGGLLNAKWESGPVSVPAKALYHEEGILEIDEGAQLSRSEEGAYVQAWLWISESDLLARSLFDVVNNGEICVRYKRGAVIRGRGHRRREEESE